jgi:glycosyltransferase involved in cell wall biosynthesis
VPAGPTIGVVICVYTEARWGLIQDAIRSVTTQSRPADDLVVVVDHHAALLGRLETELRAEPRVRVLANRHAPGLSGGRNTGTEALSTDVVAFLDDDAAAAPGWLGVLAAAFLDPTVIGAGGTIEPAWAGARPAWWPRAFDWVVGCTYEGTPDRVARIRNPIGANMAFRRSVILGSGGFVEGVGRGTGRPLGGEETELSIRATAANPGSRILHLPEAAVRHHVPAARASLRYFVERCYAEGLSKATISRLVGSGSGLASERRYTTRVLPRAALRAIALGVRRLDPGQVLQAPVIALGLWATATGYAVGRVGALLGRAPG